VRIEVGYGLEGDLTDAVTRLIIENAILPRFRAGDFSGGIERGVDDVIQVLTGDAAAFKERAERQTREEGVPDWVFVAALLALWATVIILSHLRRRRGRWVWVAGLPGGSSSGGFWSGGSSWSRGGSSGGGFSGGGGSFGGGGSSGRW
jgi:uncharacterized protein